MHANSPTSIGKGFLRAMTRSAVAADPRDAVICAIGEHQFSTIFGIIPDTFAVLRAAAVFEPDHAKLLDWYLGERIACLGGLSAAALVNIGRATLVIDFLKDVEAAERDAVVSYSVCRRNHA
jgi:hypothetical protein